MAKLTLYTQNYLWFKKEEYNEYMDILQSLMDIVHALVGFLNQIVSYIEKLFAPIADFVERLNNFGESNAGE